MHMKGQKLLMNCLVQKGTNNRSTMEASRIIQAQARASLVKTIDCLTDVLHSRGSDIKTIEKTLSDLQVRLDVLEDVQTAVEMKLEKRSKKLGAT